MSTYLWSALRNAACVLCVILGYSNVPYEYNCLLQHGDIIHCHIVHRVCTLGYVPNIRSHSHFQRHEK